MKTNTLPLLVLACFGLGPIAAQGLHAGQKTPVYVVAEIDVTDADSYAKEYAPRAQASLEAHGGRILAASQEVTAIEGTPPKRRVAILVWQSLEQVRAWRNSAQYKEDRKIGQVRDLPDLCR